MCVTISANMCMHACLHTIVISTNYYWIYSHPSVRPCDLCMSDNYTWNYAGVPESTFQQELRPAPRFEFKKYKKEKVCPPHSMKTRLDEYKALYNQTPEKSWWGWKFYNHSAEEGEWCYCFNCLNDQLCGGLWHAERFSLPGGVNTRNKKRVHVVANFSPH